jgi:hypothetical protein
MNANLAAASPSALAVEFRSRACRGYSCEFRRLSSFLGKETAGLSATRYIFPKDFTRWKNTSDI